MFSKTALCAAVLSQALPTLAVIHEQMAAVPAGWTAASAADKSTPVSFTIALMQQNIDQLEAKLMAVSTPGSPFYGQYMDVDDMNAFFAPATGASSAVESWLKSAGVSQSQMSTDGSYVTFATTVGTANSLLNTTFMNFVSAGNTKIRTLQYSIPDDLASYIELIAPTVFLGQTTAAVPTSTRKTKRDRTPTTPSVAAACSTSITPSCLKEMYNTVGYTPLPEAGSRIGFGSFLNESAIYSDLFMYEQYFNIPQQNFTTILVPGSGATNDQNITTAQYGEANLDVRFSLSLTYSQADCVLGPKHRGNEPPTSSD